MNGLRKQIEGYKLGFIVKKFNKISQKLYPNNHTATITRLRLNQLLNLSDEDLKWRITLMELEIFCKIFNTESKELLK